MRTSLKPIPSPLLDLILQARTNTARKWQGNYRPQLRQLSTICLRCQFRGRSFKQLDGTKPKVTGRRLNWVNSQKWFSDSPGPLPTTKQLESTARKEENPLPDDLQPVRAEKPPSVPENEFNPIVKDQIEPQSDTTSSQDRPSAVQRQGIKLPPSEVEPTRSIDNDDSHVPKEDLPSYVQGKRWDFSKRLQPTMEHLVSRLNVASQRLNNATGTDYTGINALRAEISEQERHCKASGVAVTDAKTSHDAAFAAQAASQKEVVQLLERKHSWSATDLERYMQLIRSEHVNEQRVQAAKENLASAERKLEDARARLEKIERKQYHEEQIWSDTIRRNSTWVTFGLMGFNILLLLASLGILEPWRRRRLVREIRSALNEKAIAPAVVGLDAGLSVASPPVEAAVEAAMEAFTPLINEPLEDVKASFPVLSDSIIIDPTGPEPVIMDSMPAGVELPPSAITSVYEILPGFGASVDDIKQQSTHPDFSLPLWADTWDATWKLYKAYWHDLFSERRVSLRKVDMTATALEGAAAGAAFMGLLFVFLRPR